MKEMFPKKRYILGAGAHGRVVADILVSQNLLLTGFLDDDTNLHGNFVGNWLVINGSELLDTEQGVELIVALGNAPLRLRLTQKYQSRQQVLINAVHAHAVISPTANLGSGICVCAGAVVNPFAMISNAAIINTGATVDHDCQIGEGVHLSPGVHLAGRVSVGRLSFLGTGVNVAPRIQIGANCIVGAGSVVVNDLPDGVLAYGCPARVISHDTESFDWSRLL